MEIVTPGGEKRELTTWYKSGEREVKATTARIPEGSINEKNRTIFAVASGGEVDRDGEILDPKGWDWKNFLDNPVLLAVHDYSKWPIGIINWIRPSKKRNTIVFEAFIHDRTQEAVEAWELFKLGILRAFSVGFIPKKWEYAKEDEAGYWRKSLEQELLEVSAVPVPAYPGALLTDANEDLKSWMARKGASLSKDFSEILRMTKSDCGVWVPASSLDAKEEEPEETVEPEVPEEDPPGDLEVEEASETNGPDEDGDRTIELLEMIESLKRRLDEMESGKNPAPEAPEEEVSGPKETPNPKRKIRLVRKEAPKPTMTKEQLNELVKQHVKDAGIGDIVKDAVRDRINLIRGRVT